MPPPRHRFAIVNWIAVYPLITVVLWLLGPTLSKLPLPAETFVISAVLVSLMNFLVMPLMTRAFHIWLHPTSKRQRSPYPGAHEARQRTPGRRSAPVVEGGDAETAA